MLRDLLRKGDYLIKINLTDAYFTVPVSPKHQKYVRFEPIGNKINNLAQSEELAKPHASTTIYLLESLGFLVNFEKLVLIPATEMEFLGFVVNSLNLTLALPRDKTR